LVQTTAISSAPVLQNSSPLMTHIKSPAHETEKNRSIWFSYQIHKVIKLTVH
jgi:hypothetical protein